MTGKPLESSCIAAAFFVCPNEVEGVSAMKHMVRVEKLDESKRFRSMGQILGVGFAADGTVWLELGASSPGVPPTLLSVQQKGAEWKVAHVCSVLRSGKLCWHVPAAIDVAHEVLGLKRLTTGTYVVDVEEKNPLTPAGPLTDWTMRTEGHVYSGSKLVTVLTADPTASASAGAGGTGSGSAPGGADPAPSPIQQAMRNATGGAPGRTNPPGYGIALILDPELDRVVQYLEDMGVPTEMREEVAKVRRKSVPAEYVERVPRGPVFQGNKEEFKLAIACFLLEKNLFTVGPKSSGKTALTVTLAWVFNLPLFTVQGNLQTEVAHFQGDKSLEVDPETKQAHVTYILGVITESMKVGGLGYVDEMPNIREGIAVWLNSLDWRKAVEVPGFGVVKAHPSFRLAMSGNKGYAGCAVPNEATIDRTTVIEMPYATDIAKIILQESRNKSEATADKLEGLFKDIKFLIDNKQIRTASPLTIRGLIDAADYMGMGIPGRVALRACVLNKMWDASDKDREKVASAIDSAF